MNFFRHIVSVVVCFVLSTICGTSLAQNLNSSNLSSSPYNRYGYGRMGSLGNTVTRSMGDVGIAVRSNQFTTVANPASLTAIDTLTMIFTVGLDAQFGSYSEDGNHNRKWDAGFNGMSFQAPLWNNFAMSLSLSPYSMVGYYYGSSDKTPVQNPTQPHDTLSYASTHSGIGGINNFMFGLGWRPLRTKKQELSVGANVGWLFGQVQHSSTLSTSSQANNTFVMYDASVRALYLQFGAQYTYRIDASNSLTIGAIYAPELNMTVNASSIKFSTDTIMAFDKIRDGIRQPMRYGVGLTYNLYRKLTITGEYEMAKWGDVTGLNTQMTPQDGVFNDSYRVAFGAEYLPKTATNNFFKACRYRVGANYKTSYLKVNGKELRELNATLGMSMPVNKRSSIDLGVGYQTLLPEGGSMVKENYLTLSLGITFNEMMFFRNMLR